MPAQQKAKAKGAPRRSGNTRKKVRHKTSWTNGQKRKIKRWKAQREDFLKKNPGKKFMVPEPKDPTFSK